MAPDEEWIEEEYEDEEHIQDLLGVQDIVAAHRHLPHDASAGRHDMDVLEATGAVRRVIDTFGRDPHISSKRQKKGHLHSNILLIDCSFSSDLIPHPGCVCIAFASFQAFFILLIFSEILFTVIYSLSANTYLFLVPYNLLASQ